MKRKAGTGETVASIGSIKTDLSDKQLAAFGAATLAYNILEDQIDVLLFVVTGIPEQLFPEVSSRINGLDGKIAIIQAAFERSPLAKKDTKALSEAVAFFGEFKSIRDTLIHARLVNAAIGRGNKQRGKSKWEVLLSADALNTLYDHLNALNDVLSAGGNLLAVALTLDATAPDDPNRSRLEEEAQARLVQFRDSLTRQRSLKPLPKFPDEAELAVLVSQNREAQRENAAGWLQPFWPKPQLLHPAIWSGSHSPLGMAQDTPLVLRHHPGRKSPEK
jgi:hypothetical protein